MKCLVMLEDDARRTEAMVAALQRECDLPIVLYDTAPDLVEWLRTGLSGARLLLLDHDLGPSRLRNGERFEPGIGRDVADFLAERMPVCPVLIHSSNVPAAQGMQFCLERAGWTVTRIYPFDDLEWVERDWLPEVRRLLRSEESAGEDDPPTRKS